MKKLFVFASLALASFSSYATSHSDCANNDHKVTTSHANESINSRESDIHRQQLDNYSRSGDQSEMLSNDKEKGTIDVFHNTSQRFILRRAH